jgi:hypothetical protein
MSREPRDDVPTEGEPLPTEGLEVEEARDEDTAQLFMREWRTRVIRDPAPHDATSDGTEQSPLDTAPR